jgi:hypothetical protein
METEPREWGGVERGGKEALPSRLEVKEGEHEISISKTLIKQSPYPHVKRYPSCFGMFLRFLYPAVD